jgi:hypothetical protein
MKRKDIGVNINIDINYILVLLINQCSTQEIIQFIKNLVSMSQNQEVIKQIKEYFNNLKDEL